MSEEINKESLHKSIVLVGELYPILENQDGKILDGNTRAASNPKHHRKTIQTKNRTEEILIRVHAHHRRRISQEETRTILLELATEFLKSGVVKEKVAQEVAKVVPYTESYVLQLLPTEFKEQRKVEAGKVSAELTEQKKVEQTVTSPSQVKVNTQKHECNYCHITNGEAKEWNGHYLCRTHFVLAGENPAKFHRYFDLLDKGRQVMRDKENHSTKPQTQSPMQMTRYGDRVEMMKVQHGAEELEFVKELALLGITPETDSPIILWYTIPDAKYSDKKVCCYVHGVVHEKGKAMDKDDAIEAALKQLGWDVLVFRHGTGSVKEWAAEVKEALKF